MKKFSLALMILVLMVMSILFITACDEKTTEPTDTEDPTIIITYPANNAEIIAGTQVTIQTDVSDNEEVYKVDFYIDGSNVATDYNSPYNYEWDTTDITGDHTIYAEAYDTSDNEGTSNIITVTINEAVGNPPNPPSNPNPEENATDVSINTDLSWSCSDPDGDPLTYDIYFGTSSTPPLVNSGQSETTYAPGTLDFEETYYWKIKAYDDHDNPTTGEIWEFTTMEEGTTPTDYVAYYPFTNGSVEDFSGNGNNGTNYGATPTIDRFGDINNALDFDGIDDYLTVNSNQFETITSDVSLSLWLKTSGIDCSHPIVLSTEQQSPSNRFQLYYYESGTIGMSYYQNGGGVICPTTININDNIWHHIVGINENGTEMRIYVDGQLSSISSYGATISGLNYFMVGGYHSPSGFHYPDSKFDDIRIFNRALTDTEIQELYNELP